MRTSLIFIFRTATVVACLILIGCPGRNDKPDLSSPPPTTYFYTPQAAHADNSNSLKNEFFQQQFKDIKGADICFANFRGTPFVALMFPSFRTEDGQESLILLERLQRQWEGAFQAVVVPIEKADVVKPAIVSDPQSMWFLFLPNDRANWNLVDDYRDLFWDTGVIASDFPLDPPEQHYTSPFFWIVDSAGTIRGKLISYFPGRKVTFEELNAVLESFLGPPQQAPVGSDGAASSESGSASEEGVN